MQLVHERREVKLDSVCGIVVTRLINYVVDPLAEAIYGPNNSSFLASIVRINSKGLWGL